VINLSNLVIVLRMKLFAKKLGSAGISALALVLFWTLGTQAASAATISMSPAAAAFERGCVRSLVIQIDASGESSNAADMRITYDATQVNIIDSNPDVAGTQVKPGTAYESYFYNDVNTSSGVITLAAGSFVGTLTSQQPFATINFTSTPSATASAFNISFSGVGDTLDSNVADAATSNDLLTGVTNGNYTFVSGPCAADTQAPQVQFLSPTNGQRGVAPDANVTVRITDNQAGIDLTTVQIVVNGVVYRVGDPQVSYEGGPTNYTFTVNPDENFPSNTPSSVAVIVEDTAGNSRNSQIIFNQPAGPVADATPPQVQFLAPTAFATNYPVDGNLNVQITDNSSGINLNTVKLKLNGVVYGVDSSALTYTGSANDYTFVLNPPSDLPTNTYSVLEVTAEDNAGNEVVSYVVFNIGTVLDPGECEPTNGGVTSPGNNDGSNCYGEDISTGDATDVIIKLLTGKGNVDIFKGTIFENTVVDKIANEMGFSGTGAAFTAALLGFNLLPFIALLNAPSLLLNALGLIFARSKSKPWGIIYDYETNKPIAFAICRLYVSGTSSLVTQTVSDLQGRYGFIIAPGAYRLEVSQSGYAVHKEEIAINKGEAAYINDIKLMPINLQGDSYASRLGMLWRSIKDFYRKISPILFIVGFTLATISLLVSLHPLNVLVFLIYVFAAILMAVANAREASRFAAVIDAETGLRVPYAIVKVFDTKSWELVDTQSTNYNGRFDFWVENGDYALLVAKKGYKFPSTANTLPLTESKYNSMLKVNLRKGNNRVSVMVDPLKPGQKLTVTDPGANVSTPQTPSTPAQPTTSAPDAPQEPTPPTPPTAPTMGQEPPTEGEGNLQSPFS
jgi:hypothetical protein